MAEYDSTRALAERLIHKKGRSGVQIYRVGVGTVAVAARPWKAEGGTAADVLLATVHAVFLSPNEARSEAGQFAFPVFQRGRSDMSDSVHPEATNMAYIAASELPDEVTIEVGMLLVSRGVRYVVLRNQPLMPGDVPVLYTLSLKG